VVFGAYDSYPAYLGLELRNASMVSDALVTVINLRDASPSP